MSPRTRAAAAARAALIIAAAIVTAARGAPTPFTPLPSVVAAAREGTFLSQRILRGIEAEAPRVAGTAWRQAPGTYATATVGMEDVFTLAGRATWSRP